MNKYNIPVILGTSREGRQSEYAAKLIVDVGNSFEEVNAHLVDPRDFDFPTDGGMRDIRIPKYSKITEEADAFFIVSPEYNRSIPGSLKRLLDSEYTNYNYKPVAFAGVSNGPWGGTRVIESFLSVVRAMKMFALNADVHFPNVQEIFDENGKLLKEEYRERVQKSFEELVKVTSMIHGNDN